MNAGNAMDASGGAVVGAINDVLQPTANMMIKKKKTTQSTQTNVYIQEWLTLQLNHSKRSHVDYVHLKWSKERWVSGVREL